MVLRKWSSLIFAGLLIFGLLAACSAPAPQTVEKVITQVVEKPVQQTVVVEKTVQQTVVVEKEKVVVATVAPAPPGPKTLRLNGGTGDIGQIDPALAGGTANSFIVDMTTVGLTRQNEVTSLVQPGMATKWDTSPDGKVYTFTLRSDVPWVKWDETKGMVVKVPDCDGKDRMVTAQDFEYGILRTLNPKTAGSYAYLPASVIQGADVYNTGAITDTAKVGVKALDAQRLEMTFKHPAVYNAIIAGMMIEHAQPKWIIEGDDCTQARADRWTETGFFEGYGPFTLREWVHDSSLTLVKNPFWPGNEAVPQAKIDVVNFAMLDDVPAFGEYEGGNMDVANVPLSDIDRVKADATLSTELHITPVMCTYYYAFNTKAPFTDDVRVRRALSEAIDRQGLIDSVTKGNEQPAQWFARPGLAGAPTMKDHPDLGVKFDATKAKADLDAYLKEKGLTADKVQITLSFNQSSTHQKIGEAIQQMWKDNLGIDAKLNAQESKVYWSSIQNPKSTAQVFRGGFCQDYPDANNFHMDLFNYGGNANPKSGGGLNWTNKAYEDLLVKGAAETDPAKRVDTYAQAEDILVNSDAVVAPIYWYTRVNVTKPNVQRTYGVLGGTEELEKWDITQ